MGKIIVKYQEGEREVQGELISHDIWKTVIKKEDGKEITKETDEVSFLQSTADAKDIIESLEHVYTHYTEADIPEVDRTESLLILKLLKTYVHQAMGTDQVVLENKKKVKK